jgi:hypothetical protein
MVDAIRSYDLGNHSPRGLKPPLGLVLDPTSGELGLEFGLKDGLVFNGRIFFCFYGLCSRAHFTLLCGSQSPKSRI